MSVYDPSYGNTSNKGYAIVGKPIDFRSYYIDYSTGTPRPYQSKAEVLAWFDTPSKRVGQFDIIINTGGTLAFGVITGGINRTYYFKNGQNDNDLVLKFGEIDPELNIIAIGSSSPYTYAYSGQFGLRPSVTACQVVSSGVFRERPDITLDTDTNTGNIIARGDFSADQIQIVIKP